MNSRPNERAIDCPREVLPTPGGAHKGQDRPHPLNLSSLQIRGDLRIKPTFPCSLRTAREFQDALLHVFQIVVVLVR